MIGHVDITGLVRFDPPMSSAVGGRKSLLCPVPFLLPALAVAGGVGSRNLRASMEVVRHSWPSRRWEKKSLKIRASARRADGSVVIC